MAQNLCPDGGLGAEIAQAKCENCIGPLGPTHSSHFCCAISAPGPSGHSCCAMFDFEFVALHLEADNYNRPEGDLHQSPCRGISMRGGSCGKGCVGPAPLPRLDSGRNPSRKPDFRPGGTIAQHEVTPPGPGKPGGSNFDRKYLFFDLLPPLPNPSPPTPSAPTRGGPV